MTPTHVKRLHWKFEDPEKANGTKNQPHPAWVRLVFVEPLFPWTQPLSDEVTNLSAK